MVILLSQGVFEDVCELRQHKPGCVFRCENCNKKFKYESVYKKHIETHK